MHPLYMQQHDKFYAYETLDHVPSSYTIVNDMIHVVKGRQYSAYKVYIQCLSHRDEVDRESTAHTIQWNFS